jgi:hypothetical protein
LANSMVGGALLISLASLVITFLTYRNSGPRVSVVSHSLSIRAGEIWFVVRIANAGASEISVDGAATDLFGAVTGQMPHRLNDAASCQLVFRSLFAQQLRHAGSVALTINLGNGKVLARQVRLSEIEQAALREYSAQIDLPQPGLAPIRTVPIYRQDVI